MEIKNTTKFSREGYYTLNKALSSKIYVACIIFELVLAVFLGFIIVKDKDYVKAIIIGIMMIAYPFVLSLIMNIQLKRNYNLNKLVFESMIYEYVFTDESFLVHCSNGNNTNDSKLNYQEIYKVIDSEKYLFIFISSNQAFLVDKTCFENKDDINNVIQKTKENNIKYSFKKVKVK